MTQVREIPLDIPFSELDLMRDKCSKCAAPSNGACVPVSIAVPHIVSNETNLADLDTISTSNSVYELAECINFLIEAGYKLGCDGELIPPKWAYEAFKEADG